MPVFDELVGKRIDDPEDRVAPKIERDYNGKNKKVRMTSVTNKTFRVTMTVIGVVFGIIILSVLAYMAYIGITSFIPSQ